MSTYEEAQETDDSKHVWQRMGHVSLPHLVELSTQGAQDRLAQLKVFAAQKINQIAAVK